MKISLNWLKQFTDVDISADELVEKIGAQLGAVEEVIDLGKKYQGVVVARVVSCEKHANADKLSVCWVDDGGVTQGVERNEQGYVQVVCGAPNVREGILVAWLPPGSTVPSTVDKDPFVLGARELRGVMSNGMLASASELAISEDHNGIVEVDIEAAPGTAFADVYGLNDIIVDIENKMFTHRPDCFGILGVAREVAGIQHKQFVSPEWYTRPLDRIKPGHTKLPLVVKNEAGDSVPRFMAIAMADVTIKPSPITVQTYLNRVGIRPINNIVDTTNYLMFLTGQPLHAYDYDKVKARSGETPTLVSRLASDEGEALNLLNGKTVKLQNPTIVISTDKEAVAVGGVMGGADTEVDENTKNIIIECANFNMYSIRKTSMKHGLFTEGVTRFNKGQSPLQNDRVLEEAVAMVQSLSGAHVASDVYDIREAQGDRLSVRVSTEFINVRLGLQLETKEVASLLRNVEFDIHEGDNEIVAVPPFWRTDIEIAEDIVEEVGRLYGFDYLPLKLPTRDLTPAAKSSELELKKTIRNILSTAGANEVLTYSFVHGNILDKVGQDQNEAYKLSNAISPDLQYYRMSLIPGLLDKVHANIKAGYDEFVLFEINKAHTKTRMDKVETELPKEYTNVSLVYTANDKTVAKGQGAAYYQAQKYLTLLTDALGIEVEYLAIDDEPKFAGAKPFDVKRTARVKIRGTDMIIGVVGEYSRKVQTGFKLPVNTAGFEIDFDQLLKHQSQSSRYVALPRFPKVSQDISLRVSTNYSYQTVFDALEKALKSSQPDKVRATLTPLDIYQKHAEDSRSLTFRYTVSSYARTLTAEEVNTLLDMAAAGLQSTIGAERI